jgi:hypothetical protein
MTRLLALVVVAGVATACLTAMNRPKIVPRAEVPALEPRPLDCRLDVTEQKETRPHLDIADVTLDWPKSRMDQQGPEGAMNTIRAAACEQGAFVVHDLRAIAIGSIDQGLVYEATLATLLDDNGKPLNLKRDSPALKGNAPDAGPDAPADGPADGGSATVPP